MIDQLITDPERRHLDRVWADAVAHSRHRLPFKKGETGAAVFHPKSANRKLGPVDLVQFPDQPRPRPMPRAPFVSSTYASIEATCPDSCAWKRKGCFADAGFTKIAGALMDTAAKGRPGFAVIQEEARLIRLAFRGLRVPQDGARGGRDLRLHVGGDIDSAHGARVLGAAARDWRRRGGGAPWTFTHRWQTVDRAAWGPGISVLASVESPAQVDAAARQGYPSALVVDRFASERAHPLSSIRGQFDELPRSSGWKLIPCPAETSGTTCASCRLCLDRDLLKMGAVIGFQAHGSGATKMRERLVQLRISP